MEQALYAIQSLQPAGVGARSLEECLTLQLIQSKYFCSDTLHLIQSGLSLLGKRDYSAIAKLLNCSRVRAQQVAEMVCTLNPIPSQGYYTGATTNYQVPEAEVLIEDGQIILEMNHCMLPQIRIDRTTESLLRQDGKEDNLSYLKNGMQQARTLIRLVENRQSTLNRLLKEIIQVQADYFLHGKPLVPFTMSQLAQKLDMSCSTVSRTIQGKYILFGTQSLPLKALFSTALSSGVDAVSPACVKKHLQTLIAEEDPRNPLSDEDLRTALISLQLPISRRTVAKYRDELGILSSTKRKKRH